MNTFIRIFAASADFLASPMVLVSALTMKLVRRLGIWRMPISRFIFGAVGIYPIRDHYYEPMFNHKKYLTQNLNIKRNLQGINFNESEQLEFLEKFSFQNELDTIQIENSFDGRYYYENPNFSYGDAECLYSIIRQVHPKNIFEIGSGYSSLMVREAISKNKIYQPDYVCRHLCIEPYEMEWLESIEGIEVLRKKLEVVNLELFKELQSGDILFIDSSHMIRPQGEVLIEILSILPILNPGVYVHFHDIFSPFDYPEKWLLREVKFWNEQYLLESFLSMNSNYEIISAMNFLNHYHKEILNEKFPKLKVNSNANPGSFWIRKVS